MLRCDSLFSRKHAGTIYVNIPSMHFHVYLIVHPPISNMYSPNLDKSLDRIGHDLQLFFVSHHPKSIA